MILPSSRSTALAGWQAFLPGLEKYGAERNQVIPGHANVSGLSLALRYRLITEDELISTSLQRHGFTRIEKWLQEVCWRRYWKGWMEQRPAIWTEWRQRVQHLRQSLPQERLDRCEDVLAGRSGVPCMDFWANELRATGYLHNHARMWWASFWIHAERLPWELGADFFFRYLHDADPASNTLSWRWVAGLQTPGKAYLVRLSSLEKYAPSHVDARDPRHQVLADGAITAVPQKESADLSPQALPTYLTALPATGPRTGLWLHPDDLSPETGPLAGLQPAAVAACYCGPIYRDHYRLSDARIATLHVVLTDAIGRAADRYRCPAVVLETPDPAAALASWALAHQLTDIVAAAPCVGPVKDALPRTIRRLAAQGVKLTLVQRPSDAEIFPMARAGFFPFWQKLRPRFNATLS